MNYAATAAKTVAMLAKSGMAMTLRVTTPGTYDPETGTESGAVVADHPCVGVLTEAKAYYIANSLMEAGDKVVLMGADVAVRPQAGQQIVIGSDVWQVVAVVTVEPAGVPVLYKVQVRRG